MSYLEIAPEAGVHRNTVGQWITAWKEGGQAALKVKPGGRPKGSGGKLYPHEEREIRKRLVDHCPDQLRLPFALWTRQAVWLHIKISFGVEIPVHGGIFETLGLHPSKTGKTCVSAK